MIGPAAMLGWARSSNATSRRRTDFVDLGGEAERVKVQTPAPRDQQWNEGTGPTGEGDTAVEGDRVGPGWREYSVGGKAGEEGSSERCQA